MPQLKGLQDSYFLLFHPATACKFRLYSLSCLSYRYLWFFSSQLKGILYPWLNQTSYLTVLFFSLRAWSWIGRRWSASPSKKTPGLPHEEWIPSSMILIAFTKNSRTGPHPTPSSPSKRTLCFGILVNPHDVSPQLIDTIHSTDSNTLSWLIVFYNFFLKPL